MKNALNIGNENNFFAIGGWLSNLTHFLDYLGPVPDTYFIYVRKIGSRQQLITI